jgi:hypothetical protein
MLIVVVLLVTVLLRFVIVAAVVYLLLPRGVRCPHCDAEMLAIRNRFIDVVLRKIERRWCMACGWNGVIRRPPRPAATPTGPRRPEPRPTPE